MTPGSCVTQTPFICLLVYLLKSHKKQKQKRAGSPGFVCRSNRSPLLQKAPSGPLADGSWSRGAGVEWDSCGGWRGWFAGMDTSPTFYLPWLPPLTPGCASWLATEPDVQGLSELSDWTTRTPDCIDFTRSTRRVTSFLWSTQLLMMPINWTIGLRWDEAAHYLRNE